MSVFLSMYYEPFEGKRPIATIHYPPTFAPLPAPPRLSPSRVLTAPAVGQYRGAASLADVILGMLFCLGVSVTVTDGIKLMVGRPRPNYSALRALVEFGGKEMSSFKVRCGAVRYRAVWCCRIRGLLLMEVFLLL